jgi:Tfp pilus assembly protein PilN
MIEINLLPKEYRKRSTAFRFDKKWLYAGGAVGMVILLLASLTLYKKHTIDNLDKKIVSVQRQRAALDKDVKLIDGLTDLKQKLLTRLAAIEKLDKNRGMWVAILEDVTNRVPELLWITDLSEEAPQQNKAAARRRPGAANPRDLVQADTVEVQLPSKRPAVIEGYAYTLNSIASFLVGMMKSDYFDDIELAYAKQETVQDVAAYNFKINCVVDYDAWLKEEIQPEATVSSPLADQ